MAILFLSGTIMFSLRFRCIFGFLGAFKGRCMLLKGCFWSFLQQCVYTFVQIVARHVVVYDTQATDVDCALIVAYIDVEVSLSQVTLLLHQLNVLFTWTALSCSDTLLFAIALTFALLNCIVLQLLIKDRILTIDCNEGRNFLSLTCLFIIILLD